MISGNGERSLASINGETFAVGETHNLTVAKRKVTVTCMEIRDQSVVAKVAGEPNPLVLRLGDSVPLAAAP